MAEDLPAMATWKFTLLFGLLLAGGAAPTVAGGWQWFRSSRGSIVMYPMEWHRFGSSLDRLNIRSSRGGAEGVIIKPGQSDIGVLESPDSVGSGLGKVVHYYAGQDSILSRSNVPLGLGHHGCDTLTEVIFKQPIIPIENAAAKVPITVNDLLLCKAEDRMIVTLQRNFEGDRRQSYYRRIAMKMAKSIAVVSR